MEVQKSEDKLFTFDDKVTVLIGIELEAKKIAYFISFYRQTNANQINKEGILDFDNSKFQINDDYLQVLLIKIKEISKIENIIESQILWFFCVNFY